MPPARSPVIIPLRPRACRSRNYQLTKSNACSRYALLPAGLIGRLAVDQKYQGQRLGSALIMDAAARAEPAIFALIVDAKDDSAVTFYQRHEFRRFVSTPASLFLPIATALQALSTKRAVKEKPRK